VIEQRHPVAGGAASPGFMDGTFLTNSSVLSLSSNAT
jgi:hypothetical protein